MAKVYSSLNGFPSSHTTAKRSASGSTANPTSALFLTTAVLSISRFSGNGSVPLLNSPFGSQFIRITSQLNDSSNLGTAS